MDLGEEALPSSAPLAARMRPRSFDEVAGHEGHLAQGAMLRSALSRGRLPSIILWGPPGCGKTTLAHIIARELDAEVAILPAVESGVKDIRRVVEEARALRRAGRRTVVFIDEIHRFNKAQQDAILPHVEDGTFTLIGATTENPSFEVIPPLLSRTRVIRLEPLAEEQLAAIVEAATVDEERGLGSMQLALDTDARGLIVRSAQGDARAALTVLDIAAELASGAGRGRIETADVREAIQDERAYYDRGGDRHFDTISAFIKTMRGSDPDAALYWLARMIDGGEDPAFIVRRMVIFAAEDVGLADPQALVVAMACQQAVHFVGVPEGFLPLAECCIYLASAPKSNSALTAYVRALEDAKRTGALSPPLHIRNAPTALMRAHGYGQGYRYAHDEPGHVAQGVSYFPTGFEPDAPYYRPGSLGFEPQIAAHLARIREPGHGDPGGEGTADED
jgi:putative ATPase